MSPHQTASENGFSCACCLVSIAILIVVIGLLFPAGGGFGCSNRELQKRYLARTDIVSIRMALKYYYEEYGTVPPTNHVEMMKVLRGNNPKGYYFLDIPKRPEPRGEFLDPWGSPYRVDLSDPAAPRVYSIGKDHIYNGGARDSDDVASWQ